MSQLRLMLKEHAEMQKPRLNLPKGLTRMTHAQLLEECDKQGVATEDSGGRLGLKTREMMIRDLRLHARVEAALLVSSMSGTGATMGDQEMNTVPTSAEDGFEVLSAGPPEPSTSRRAISRAARAAPSAGSRASGGSRDSATKQRDRREAELRHRAAPRRHRRGNNFDRAWWRTAWSRRTRV